MAPLHARMEVPNVAVSTADCQDYTSQKPNRRQFPNCRLRLTDQTPLVIPPLGTVTLSQPVGTAGDSNQTWWPN